MSHTKTDQTFQVLAVFPTEATVGFPYPVPAGSMSTPSSKEYDGVIGFHWGR